MRLLPEQASSNRALSSRNWIFRPSLSLRLHNPAAGGDRHERFVSHRKSGLYAQRRDIAAQGIPRRIARFPRSRNTGPPLHCTA